MSTHARDVQERRFTAKAGRGPLSHASSTVGGSVHTRCHHVPLLQLMDITSADASSPHPR